MSRLQYVYDGIGRYELYVDFTKGTARVVYRLNSETALPRDVYEGRAIYIPLIPPNVIDVTDPDGDEVDRYLASEHVQTLLRHIQEPGKIGARALEELTRGLWQLPTLPPGAGYWEAISWLQHHSPGTYGITASSSNDEVEQAVTRILAEAEEQYVRLYPTDVRDWLRGEAV